VLGQLKDLLEKVERVEGVERAKRVEGTTKGLA